MIKIILGLIDRDKKIKDDSSFFVCPDGNSLTKEELRSSCEICLPSFILGIWLYIICEKIPTIEGQDTYRFLFKKNGKHRPAKLDMDTEIAIKRDINVIMEIPEKSIDLKHQNSDCNIEETNQLENDTTKRIQDNSTICQSENSVLFDEYVENIRNVYAIIKTSLYFNEPKNFCDIYVESYLEICSDIIGDIKKKQIPANIRTIEEYSRFVILLGGCGSGKSMIIQHILISAVNMVEDGGRIPVCIRLKDYVGYDGNLLNFICETMRNICKSLEDAVIINCMAEGNILLLLDGLDEVEMDKWNQFSMQVAEMVNRYSKNMYILSSRPIPYKDFDEFNKFKLIEIKPFSRDQIKELIYKIGTASNLSEAKFLDIQLNILDPFKKEQMLFDNPLFFTKYIAYAFRNDNDNDIEPSKICWLVYDMLFNRCKNDKFNVWRRMKTGLELNEFAYYFSGICADAYCENKRVFTSDDISRYLRRRDDRNYKTGFDVSDFLHDATISLCLLKVDDGRYSFGNRTMEEYFCARYYFNKPRCEWAKIESVFRRKMSRSFNACEIDFTIDFLYEMDSESVEKYIFFPYLNKWVTLFDSQEGYWSFLKYMHPIIGYYSTETVGRFTNDSLFVLYEFIIEKKGLKEWIKTNDLPECPSYNICFSQDISMEDRDFFTEKINNISRGEIDSNNISCNPGRYMQFEVKKVLEKDDDESRSLVKAMDNENFPLKKEYNNVLTYLKFLQAKYTEFNTY